MGIIINLTPDTINVIDYEGERLITYYASDTIARIATQPAYFIGPINVYVSTEKNVIVTAIYPRNPDDSIDFKGPVRVTEMVQPKQDTYYIVSDRIREALPHRIDLLSPERPTPAPDGTINCYGFVVNPLR